MGIQARFHMMNRMLVGKIVLTTNTNQRETEDVGNSGTKIENAGSIHVRLHVR